MAMDYMTQPTEQAVGTNVVALNHDTPLPLQYQSYLLRLWRTQEGEWHGSLQAAQNGERHLFADVESLVTFLYTQLQP